MASESRKTEQDSCFVFKEKLNMAAGQNVPQLGGYDYEFTGTVPED